MKINYKGLQKAIETACSDNEKLKTLSNHIKLIDGNQHKLALITLTYTLLKNKKKSHELILALLKNNVFPFSEYIKHLDSEGFIRDDAQNWFPESAIITAILEDIEKKLDLKALIQSIKQYLSAEGDARDPGYDNLDAYESDDEISDTSGNLTHKDDSSKVGYLIETFIAAADKNGLTARSDENYPQEYISLPTEKTADNLKSALLTASTAYKDAHKNSYITKNIGLKRAERITNTLNDSELNTNQIKLLLFATLNSGTDFRILIGKTLIDLNLIQLSELHSKSKPHGAYPRLATEYMIRTLESDLSQIYGKIGLTNAKNSIILDLERYKYFAWESDEYASTKAISIPKPTTNAQPTP